MQLASMLPAPAAADDRAIAGIVPNVLIVLDASSRMGEAAPSNAYVAAKKYSVQRRCHSTARKGRTTTQACTPAAVFKSPSYALYAESPAAITGRDSAAARRALAQSGTWSGTLRGTHVTLHSGNYVNYLFAPCGTGGACPDSKLATVQRVLGAVLDSYPDVRFGLMIAGQARPAGGGARVLEPIGGGVASMKTALATAVPGPAGSLGDALYDAGQYFKGQPLSNGTSFPSPIQVACQTNHIIVITDGAQASGAHSLTAEATLRRQQDHSTSREETQRVIVHTIALGANISDRARSELNEAADNAGGAHFHASGGGELESSLRQTLERITHTTYTLSDPVVPALPTSDGGRAYLASFQSASTPFWRGSLKAYRRDPTGGVPVDADGLPLASALLWDAARALNTMPPGRRTIYTEIGGTLAPFTKSNSAITTKMLGVAAGADRGRLIDMVRGGDGSGTRDRAWKLGAIVHSTPVVVSPPVLTLTDPSYEAFKAAQAKRTKIVIVGADDGMLHAFRESDGVEVWAFIPPDMLDRVSSVFAASGGHPSFSDGSPIAADIKIGGTWRTVVLFGCRRGGAYYYALDITETTTPKFLWRFTDAKIRETWSTPAIGKVKLGGQDTYVAFVGGGPTVSGDDASGKALFVIDVATGTKLWEYANVPAASDDRRHMTFGLPAPPTAVDADNDGYVDRVYSGDAGGQMWKFDVRAADTSGWKGKRVFASSTSDDASSRSAAIDVAPALTMDQHRNIWLLFGTAPEANTAAPGRFYALRDDNDMSNGTTLAEDSASIKDVTAGPPSGSRGWYVALGRGEKVVGAPKIFNGTVLFTTLAPGGDGCGAVDGTARLYALRAWNGQAAVEFTTGGDIGIPTATSRRSKRIGRGITSAPIVILVRPRIPGTPSAAFAMTSTANQEITTTAIPAPAFLKHVKSWRERAQ